MSFMMYAVEGFSFETYTDECYDDASFFMTPNCGGGTATITGDLGGSFAFNPIPSDGAAISPITGEVVFGVSGATYSVEYTTAGPSPETSIQIFTVLINDDASFFMTPNCGGATATITGDLGGVFAFNPIVGDGAVIDPITGVISEGSHGTTYTVMYTTWGDCPDSSLENVTVFTSPEIVTPTAIQACTVGGITEYNLDSRTDEILNGSVDVSLTFHESFSDAANGINALTSPYINTVSNQILFVRGEDLVSGCYSIVELELIAVDCLDTDTDGVIDADEDINRNGNLDDDDTDMDSIPNYLDNDDDGDLVDTIDEISIVDGRTMHDFIDTDGDLIENYLDDDDDGDGVLTVDEDYNNNGNPTDDDTNSNSIPDYLDSTVALSINTFNFNSYLLYPNPTKTFVNIEFNTNVSEKINVNIYDVQGKLVLNVNSKIDGHKVQLDVSYLSKGMYFVELKNNHFKTVEKLIVE